MTKPSLDGIGSWLEGRLTKFIAGEGEGEDSPAQANVSAALSKPAYGPFSHYSSITSAAPSTAPSPQPSIINTHVLPEASQPPRRSGSAMAVRAAAQTPVDRASSAMDIRHRASPVAKSSASATAASFHHGTPSYMSPYSPYSPSLGTSLDTSSYGLSTTKAPEDAEGESTQTWWGANSESSSATPTAPTFVRVGEDTPTVPSSGFISLMDDAIDISTNHSAISSGRAGAHEDDDEEDLGFGNSSNRKKATKPEAESSPATADKPKEQSKAPPAKPGKPPGACDAAADF